MTEQKRDLHIFQHPCLQQMMRYLLPGLGLAALSVGMGAPAGAANRDAQLERQPALQALDQAEIRLLNLPPELQGTGKWAAFKALWRRLDDVKPAVRSSTEGASPEGVAPRVLGLRYPVYDQRTYYQALDAQQAQHMQQELRDIFGETVISPQARLLLRLTQLRIQEMSTPYRGMRDFDYVNGSRALMTRMMPTPAMLGPVTPVSPTVNLVNTMDRIEARADALIALRAKGVVSEEAFATALDALHKDAGLALYLDMWLTQMAGWVDFWLTPADFLKEGSTLPLKAQSLQNVKAWETAIKVRLSRLEGTQQEQFKVLAEKQRALREALDGLAPLLAELER